MSALLAKIGGPLVITGTMILAAMFLGIMALTTVRGMLADARANAIAERDAHWSAEIERSEKLANAQIVQNLKNTMAAQDAARDKIALAEDRARQLETRNADLQDTGRCGVSRDRGRLLDQR